MEYLNPNNLAELNRDMSKTEAEEEIKTTKASFKDFVQRCEQDPQNVHKDLNQCEIDSLKLVDPDAHVDEEVLYSRHRSNKPSMAEYRDAQPASGYPTRLPLGLKSLRTQDDPEVIKTYTDILQATEGPVMDKFQASDCYFSMTVDTLTMNHGNFARNPKLDGRELKGMPMRDRPHECYCATVLTSYASTKRARCSIPKTCKGLTRFFFLTGYKGIVIKSWSERPIACFVRGNEHARVELLARYISTRSQNWGTTFRMFICFFGTEIGCIDPEYDTPTFDCLATTGSHMTKKNLKDYVGQRLPPRTAIAYEFRGALPKSTKAPNTDYDSRHILRAGLPYATAGVFHIHPNITHGAAREGFQNGIMPLVTTYQCDAITGDANNSANTYSRLQWVYNPEYGLINLITQTYQDTWNTTRGMPIE